MPRDVYIVECVRSPLARGKKDGALHEVLPVHLLATVLDALAKKSKIDKKIVEDVVCGCVTPINSQGGNIGRLATLQAGYPIHVSGVQINRMCGSGQQAIHFISQAIASGDIEIGIACGIEMMSVVPMGSDFPPQEFMKKEFRDQFPFQLIHQGLSAEKIAEKYNISRKDCDQFAIQSHHKAGIARNLGFYDHQIIPIEVKKKDKNDPKNIITIKVTEDEGIRFPPNPSSVTNLKTVFKNNGVVTAGNASQITDGASALLLASAEAVKKYNLKVRARILSRVCVGSDPVLMLDGVIPATQQALQKAGLNLDDIDLFEINEAFASVVLAWQKTLKIDMNKVNICGGACAHGHPLGATGCVLMTKLINDLERTNKRYGLQTMCIGWGMATGTVIEKTNKILPSKYSKL